MIHRNPIPLVVAAMLALQTAPLPAGPAPSAQTPAPGIASETVHEAVHEAVTLPVQPSLSPDGRLMAFAWNGDIWISSSSGGEARRLTQNDAAERTPVFSRDGTQVAFASRRENNVWQVFVMPVVGGNPRQVTFHSEGSVPVAWFPGDKALLVSGMRDQTPFQMLREDAACARFFRVELGERKPETLLFDEYGYDASLSQDGRRLLFVRENHEAFRLGYRGPMSPQIWLYDLDTRQYKCLLKGETGYRSPVWTPDGKGFYCVDAAAGAYNLARYDFASGRLSSVGALDGTDAGTPALSADGATLVYTRNLDLWRMDPGKGVATKIELFSSADRRRDPMVRRVLRTAADAEFSPDGLDVFFAAGGDLWVMDTSLMEPRAVTSTPDEETSPCLSTDGKALYFVRDSGDGCEIMKAARTNPDRYWWENDDFAVAALTSDKAPKSDLCLSPDGKRLAYVRGLGDLVVRDLSSGSEIVLCKSMSEPEYDWSPDGRWIAYSAQDDDANRDVHLVPVDGSAKPVNVSRHPDNDYAPSFSPDGRCLAWLQMQAQDRVELAYVWLARENADRSARDRRIEAAREKMAKERGAPAKADDAKASPGNATDAKKPQEKGAPADKALAASDKVPGADKAGKAQAPEVRIDLEDIHRRVINREIPTNGQPPLAWTPESDRVVFQGTCDGKNGLVSMPIAEDAPKPSLVAPAMLKGVRRLSGSRGYAGISNGVPAAWTKGALAEYRFQAKQEFDGSERRRVVFLHCWRTMRDRFYDAALNNRDWNAVRARYEPAAVRAADTSEFDRVVNMMLGELNASHMGYASNPEPRPAQGQEWKYETRHIGVRFDPAFAGPGLRILDVVPEGPADRNQGRLDAGEIVLAIDGTPVDASFDLTQALNGPMDRDILVRIRGKDGAERSVPIRPESYASIRRKLRADRLRVAADKVGELSGGRLGYLHIERMDWKSFREFQRGIYEQGAGKDGLVIDVRDNGGGSTTDHLLTILTQPRHAFTVQRGGGPGYPQDRNVYASWHKPIVVLCNHNSYSNAEVFSHAIKALGRGKLVGEPTAGAVISTYSYPVFDVGMLRMPGRGWYALATGADYELNGAKPDFEIWTQPGEMASGRDRQLEKAVEVLLKDVSETRPLPKPVPAHSRGR